MRWPWSKPPRPEIPPYRPPVKEPTKPEPAIIVEEHDVSKFTQTGVYKAWRRMTGQDKSQ